jgi:hypothetical protein
MDQSTLWLQYLNELNSVVALQAGEALQVIYPYTTWDWGGKNPVAGSYSYEEWATLNVVPSDPQLNGNSNAGASMSGFDASYATWFNTLAIGDLAKDTHYQSLQSQLAAAINKSNADNQNINNIWMNQTQGNGSFAVWLSEQQGYQATINEDSENITALQTELNTYRGQIEAPLASLTQAYNNTHYMSYVTDPNTAAQVQLRVWNTTSYPNPWAYLMDVTNNTFGGNATKGNGVSFSFNESAENYEYSQYYSEVGGGGWDDFIVVETGGTFEQIDWSSFSSSYSMTFDFQDMQTVPVTTEGWYSGTYIGDFGNGPYATGFSAFESGNDNYFFGAGGGLSRIYTGLIVGYRPTVTINASEDFSNYVFQKCSEEDGVASGLLAQGLYGAGSSSISTSESIARSGPGSAVRIANPRVIATSTA